MKEKRKLFCVILRLLWSEFMGARRRRTNDEFVFMGIPLTGDSNLEPRYFVASNAIH